MKPTGSSSMGRGPLWTRRRCLTHFPVADQGSALDVFYKEPFSAAIILFYELRKLLLSRTARSYAPTAVPVHAILNRAV